MDNITRMKILCQERLLFILAFHWHETCACERTCVLGCMCIRKYAVVADQNAIDVRKTEELRLLDPKLPIAVVVFNPSASPTMQVEMVSESAPSARCERCEA